jgi:hypothetical protein
MINVVNKSTLVTDDDVKIMVQAVAHQLRYDAAPAWGRTLIGVSYLPDETSAAPGSWVIAVLDDPDQQDALGWHTQNQGEVIFGRVFARPVLEHDGDALTKPLSVATILSHEVLETFCDPYCNLWADNAAGAAVALEVADPVESDSYPVAVPGHGDVTVSNFVTPAWFNPMAKKGSQFDHLGTCRKPFEIAKGGYVVTQVEGKVKQVFGRSYPAWRKATKLADVARTAHRLREGVH